MNTLSQVLENCERRRIAYRQYPGMDSQPDNGCTIELKSVRCLTCACCRKCFATVRPAICGAYEALEELSPTWGQYVAGARRYQEKHLL